MNYAYILMGGNMGDREKYLQQAMDLLNRHGGTIRDRSSIYETAPWGITNQQHFLNQAVLLETDLTPGELMKEILLVEEKIGRIREEKYGPRVIDIDILFYNDAVIHESHLIIPHPEMQNRRFALAPLAEIAPDIVHPLLDKTVSELFIACPDQLEVTVYP